MPSIDELLGQARDRLPHRPTAEEFSAVVARGALVVDIRPADQRDRDGEIHGAIVIDRNVLEWRLDPASEWCIDAVGSHDREIVVVCNEGYASSLAAATLQAIGLRHATDLDGGFQALLAYARNQREETD